MANKDPNLFFLGFENYQKSLGVMLSHQTFQKQFVSNYCSKQLKKLKLDTIKEQESTENSKVDIKLNKIHIRKHKIYGKNSCRATSTEEDIVKNVKKSSENKVYLQNFQTIFVIKGKTLAKKEKKEPNRDKITFIKHNSLQLLKSDIESMNKNKFLYSCCKNGKIDKFKAVLHENFDPHSKINSMFTDNFMNHETSTHISPITRQQSCLSLSAKFNQKELLRFLLENIKWSKNELKEALECANDPNIMKLLKEQIQKSNLISKLTCCISCIFKK